MKNTVAKIISKTGYQVTRKSSADVSLFNSLCAYHFESSGSLNDKFLQHCLTFIDQSHSQRFQDLMADFFMARKPGVFCEFGATNGMDISNSYFLETHRNWKGILAEPGKRWHSELKHNRPNAIIDARCVYSVSGESVSFSEAADGVYSAISKLAGQDAHQALRSGSRQYDVETISLNDLLDEHGIAKLDFLSVDTEGSEFEILKHFDFKKYQPSIIAVEHNYTEHRAQLYDLISNHGYKRIFEEYSAFDDWYVLPEILQRTETY